MYINIYIYARVKSFIANSKVKKISKKIVATIVV